MSVPNIKMWVWGSFLWAYVLNAKSLVNLLKTVTPLCPFFPVIDLGCVANESLDGTRKGFGCAVEGGRGYGEFSAVIQVLCDR